MKQDDEYTISKVLQAISFSRALRCFLGQTSIFYIRKKEVNSQKFRVEKYQNISPPLIMKLFLDER